MKYTLSLITICGVLLICACESKNVEEDFPTGPCNTTTSTYSGEVQPIIETNCYRCHDDETGFGGVFLESYSNVAAYANSGALEGVMRGINGYPVMPDDAATMLECDIQTVELWIMEGAQNN